MARTVILDVDGTLVDTNYQHAIAWDRALREHDLTVPMWRIHRHIGMGGDQIVAALAGEEAERRCGDAVREAEGERYAELVEEVRVLPGARELIAALREDGRIVVLASSAKEDEVDRYIEMLDARDAVHAWTTSADVEQTKPEPDLIKAALAKADSGDEAIVVGDTVWDMRAAGRVLVPAIGVLTGGFAEAELRAAGAVEVFESVAELAEDLQRSAVTV